MKKWPGYAGLVLFGIFAAFLITEITLHFYNPIVSRVKGNKIVLPRRQKYTIHNDFLFKLDKRIPHTKNALGFRGEDLPRNPEEYFSLIAVGGSTAECLYLADGEDWPAVLGRRLKEDYPGRKIWVNNAGLDGHSTFGHQILLNDYLIKIKPRVLVFLIGVNDIGRKDLVANFDDRQFKSRLGLKQKIVEKCELCNLYINYFRVREAVREVKTHQNVILGEMETLAFSRHKVDSLLDDQRPFLPAFEKRIESLIETCRNNGILPIFCTQPMQWGYGTDSLTGVKLDNLNVEGLTSAARWEIMELYNRSTRAVCGKTQTWVIDLANEMPKNSLYFYDGSHFTKEGAALVAAIIESHLLNDERQLFP